MSALTINKLTSDEISDTFDYLKHIALDALATRKVDKMYFTLNFEVGCATQVTSDISEYYHNNEIGFNKEKN